MRFKVRKQSIPEFTEQKQGYYSTQLSFHELQHVLSEIGFDQFLD